ncbi:hypothetical protein V2K52_02335 [Pseudomonas alliivorans]|uniref:hypothetical protein n=1 Tax=Pseudomonas alliivorans TaxID=2810613 RepID=UPI001AE750DE|nr:hypothetical protein [Pseudomonas alliivorans]MBP0948884.1 hypothetical protein [Pseudomonas alliivorans]MEE4334281.1 hypothetical protein [Pseudomonas alliivorans]MEE4625115.1 hypothetical protein [Pseudomonas alliivorans]MEE4786341.1 hypothetical protein [Pseudomonas alliivorans]MEE4793304.1 hypothetical protein [Pseudomonas alliivorans]
MSTLSEIAANHARHLSALEAESARLNAPCTLVLQVFEAPTFLVIEQMPPHTIAAIHEGIQSQTNTCSL